MLGQKWPTADELSNLFLDWCHNNNINNTEFYKQYLEVELDNYGTISSESISHLTNVF